MYYIELSPGVRSGLDLRQPHATETRAMAAIEKQHGEVSFSRDATGLRVSKRDEPLCTVVYRRPAEWPQS